MKDLFSYDLWQGQTGMRTFSTLSVQTDQYPKPICCIHQIFQKRVSTFAALKTIDLAPVADRFETADHHWIL